MIVPRIHRDRRGFFSEAYNRAGSGAGRKTGIRPGQSFVVPGARRGAELHFRFPRSRRTNMYVIVAWKLLTSITFSSGRKLDL